MIHRVHGLTVSAVFVSMDPTLCAREKKKKKSDCAPIKLYLQEQVADKFDQRASLLTPGLKHKSIKKKKENAVVSSSLCFLRVF